MSKKRFIMLRKLHGKIHDCISNKNKKYKTYRALNKLTSFIKNIDEDAFILAYTPSHGNLGDHAIALAEERMLENNNVCYYELIDQQLNLLYENNKLDILNGKKLLIHGGGYLGTLWPHEEMMIRKIVVSCPKSKILLFPNTVFYEEKGLSFDESIRIYNAHQQLIICTREKISYSLVRSCYKNVLLVPDMVLYFDQITKMTNRSGCLVCLRRDHEKTITEDEQARMFEIVNTIFKDRVIYTDMVVDHNILPEKRANELNNKFMQFLTSEIVITDRLHGMIFAAITGTPCIVLNSKSPKVQGCYEWIKKLYYIKFINSVEEIKGICDCLIGKTYTYDNSHLLDYYISLVNFIKQM